MSQQYIVYGKWFYLTLIYKLFIELKKHGLLEYNAHCEIYSTEFSSQHDDRLS